MANNSTSFVTSSSSHTICRLSVPNFDPYNTANRPDSVHPTWTFLATVNGLASPPTVVINALIIWTVLGDENLRLINFNVLLATLAVTDFLVGLLVQPMYCVLIGCFMNGCHSPCQFTVYTLLMLAFSGTTSVTLAFACAERYLAIEYPNLYLQVITGKRIMTATIVSWIAVFAYLVIASNFMITNGHTNLVKVPFMVAMGVCGLITLYCSFKVQLTAYRQRRTIALQEDAVQNAQPKEQQQQAEKRNQEYKHVFVMTMLVVMSAFFYIPLIVLTAIQAIEGKEFTSNYKYISGPIWGTFVHLQSLINPIFITLRLSYIRQGIKNKLACFTCN